MSGTIAVHSIQDLSRGLRAWQSSLGPASAEAPHDGQEHADQAGGEDMNALSEKLCTCKNEKAFF